MQIEKKCVFNDTILTINVNIDTEFISINRDCDVLVSHFTFNWSNETVINVLVVFAINVFSIVMMRNILVKRWIT